ncbi:MAG: hypothetical protein E6X17_14655 [Sporomusaceae bacterium]|nr:hypothetical protein [Sporomusaceae bacterium]
MVDEVAERIYRIEVPLPKNPLKYVNAYWINGGERCLLIDTGLDRPECLAALPSQSGEAGGACCR